MTGNEKETRAISSVTTVRQWDITATNALKNK